MPNKSVNHDQSDGTSNCSSTVYVRVRERGEEGERKGKRKRERERERERESGERERGWERERESEREATHILFRSGLEVDEVILDENKAKMRVITAIMMIQAAYHGYQPAPTGSAPKRMATVPMMIL